ncbi:DUF2508 family protein [Desulfovirgula thermocuniculi]|uniref:DUF2508 family protein n=1 Tax=Desulfovirgula thermocuniculi TaxID=348842 RepID=UPI0004154626|nr:DUF2508 family protein [Desulfovirgula thermocuniculi]
MREVLARLAPRLRPRRAPGLLEIIDEARRELKEAWEEFHLAGSDLVDYTIFKINAAERRLTGLLRQARRQGLTAWPPLDRQ